MEEPGVLQSMGLQRVGHELVTEQKHKDTACIMCQTTDYIVSSLHIGTHLPFRYSL